MPAFVVGLQMIIIRVWLFLLLVGWLPGLVYAQATMPAAAVATSSRGANTSLFGQLLYGPNGAATSVAAARPGASEFGQLLGNGYRASGSLIPGATVYTDGSELAKLLRTGDVPTPVGGRLPVSAVSSIEKVALGAILGKYLLKSLPFVATGVALYDVAVELGILAGKNVATGATEFSKVVEGTPINQYVYAARRDNQAEPTAWPFTSIAPACTAYIATVDNGNFHLVTAYPATGTTQRSGGCYMCRTYDGYCMTHGIWAKYSSVPGTSSLRPVPYQEFVDTVAAKSGWPTSSRFPSLITDAVTATNQPIPEQTTIGKPSPLTLSGPSTSPGPVETITHADGTKTVTTTTFTNTYTDNTVTQTSTTTISTVNIDNSVTNISTTTTTNEPSPAEPSSKDNQPTDCDKIPDSIGCSKFGDPPASDPLNRRSVPLDITPLSFAGGSCPPPVTFTALGVQRQFSYSPLCDKLIYIKYLILALAGFFAAYVLADSFKV